MEQYCQRTQGKELPLEARCPLWDRLWATLLAPPSGSGEGTTRLSPDESDELPLGKNQSAGGDQ